MNAWIEVGLYFVVEEREKFLVALPPGQSDIEFNQPELTDIGKLLPRQIETVVAAAPLEILGAEQTELGARRVSDHDNRSIDRHSDLKTSVQEKGNLMPAAERKLFRELQCRPGEASRTNEYHVLPVAGITRV